MAPETLQNQFSQKEGRYCSIGPPGFVRIFLLLDHHTWVETRTSSLRDHSNCIQCITQQLFCEDNILFFERLKFFNLLSFRISGVYSIVRKNRKGHLNWNKRIVKCPQTKQNVKEKQKQNICFFISIASKYFGPTKFLQKSNFLRNDDLALLDKKMLKMLSGMGTVILKRSHSPVFNISRYFFLFQNKPISALCFL